MKSRGQEAALYYAVIRATKITNFRATKITTLLILSAP